VYLTDSVHVNDLVNYDTRFFSGAPSASYRFLYSRNRLPRSAKRSAGLTRAKEKQPAQHEAEPKFTAPTAR